MERPQDRINQKLLMKGRWALLPYNKEGDPAFTTLEDVHRVFSHDEITILVNRALYGMKYQKEHHQKRYQVMKDVERKESK